jgi:hypothetical protein
MNNVGCGQNKNANFTFLKKKPFDLFEPQSYSYL